MTTSVQIRSELVDMFRRDLIGPGEQDADLANERLREAPSRWYLTGYLAPADDELALDGSPDETVIAVQEEIEGLTDSSSENGAAGDDDEPEAPNTKRRFLPSSVGLTVLLPAHVTEITAKVTWGDYRTEPPLPDEVLMPEPASKSVEADGKKIERPTVEWVRVPKERSCELSVVDGRGPQVIIPGSAAEQRRGGALTLETHARRFSLTTPDGGTQEVWALTVFLVNRRYASHKFYSDASYIFQARVELQSLEGFCQSRDMSGFQSTDWDARVSDLHYSNVKEWAVGRNTAAGWASADPKDGLVTRVWTDPMPTAEVERVIPNESKDLTDSVKFELEQLADLAASDTAALHNSLVKLPELYEVWVLSQEAMLSGLPTRRKEIGEKLITEMRLTKDRIASGITLLQSDTRARRAFYYMNRAVAMAARRRNAGPSGDPAQQRPPTWRPFQLAFILQNLTGLAGKTHPDREIADLLFFPTGGGKTEAYLGLAAFMIAYRRLSNSGVLGAGVSVIMRYTLRLLTLDQLARAAGVICALELMRTDVAAGERLELGDWPIEIGLWVGSDASPNIMKGTGSSDQHSAVARVRRYRNGKDKRAPAPIKACPWCGTPFTKNSFECVPNSTIPVNLEIRCARIECEFSGNRPLPILTVDEPIYRRLPAFLIATVDKFASLPWEGKVGAFFGHVGRHKPDLGFYGAAEPNGDGVRFEHNFTLDPPDLIIQDELHLISGPLGTVAGLYETAIDYLSTRTKGELRVRPKIVASTATVRRAKEQIKALFDRDRTFVFPPPGISKDDSFFAKTVASSEQPARLYLGIAAQGRGPKLVYLRTLVTLLSAAQSLYEREAAQGVKLNAADPYMTALCYFNALRELGGARRIVEQEVRNNVFDYGRKRQRVSPHGRVFADRKLQFPLELTSRVSTDDVAKAKQLLENEFGLSQDIVDVALATNMISVGLDIQRLGLMVVQGQPKTSSEYIQATSRVGRNPEKPGLVVAVLNMHKPRDRMHLEHFKKFHETFYRSVEATSVTPWSYRALDRALAAVLVSVIRHQDSTMTPERSAESVRRNLQLNETAKAVLLERAKKNISAVDCASLERAIDQLVDDWISVADGQTAVGSQFVYSKAESAQRLLHMPLEPTPDRVRERYVSGRSMRDVEPSVRLKVVDPKGKAFGEGE